MSVLAPVMAPAASAAGSTATTTTTAVASASIISSAKISATTTVAAAGTVDPTGTVTYYFCYNATAAPASCSSATGTVITPDSTLASDGTADGSATASLSTWTPASGVGYYRFAAVYNGDSTFDVSTESGTSVNVAVDNAASCGTSPPAGTFAGGKGTQLDPFQVASAAHLAAIAGDLTTCRFLQTTDVSLASTRRWTPIVWNDTGFKGVYDGGGYAITGMRIEGGGTTSGTGLFGKLGSGASVKNLLVQGSVTGTGYLGGLTGVASGATISNVHVDVDVTGSISSSKFYVGGLVGRLNSSGRVEKSSSFGDVIGGTETGGLVGNVEASYVESSFARGAVIGYANVGGLVGQTQGSGPTITNSFATGAVSLGGGSTSTAIGGLLGKLTSGTVTTSYWNATANASLSGGQGTSKTATELATAETFSSWSIASTWSTSNSWVICAGLNAGYPALTGRYAADPCASAGAVTVTASNMTIPPDLTAPDVSFTASPRMLPGDFDTPPTCGIYDNSNTLRTGKLPAGTYSSRCTGAVWSLATSIQYANGTVTVSAANAGGRLAASLITGLIADVATATTTGTSVRRLATGSTTTMRPEWSPNGSKIAYIDEVSGLRQVFVMNADGSNVVQMTNDTSSTRRPESLVWIDNSKLLIDTANENAVILTAQNTYAGTSATSFATVDVMLNPARDKIAFIDSGNGLQVGSFDGSAASGLARDGSSSFRYPVWTKDGTALVVVDTNQTKVRIKRAGAGSFSDLYVPPSGKGVRELTIDPVTGELVFDLCSMSGCQSYGSFDVYRATIPDSGTISSTTLVLSNASAPSLAPNTTTIKSAVSTSSLTYGGDVDVDITVTSSTTTDPTGDVTLRYCYSAASAPASCDAASGTLIDTYTLAAGTANDGTATATLTDWVPAGGAGYYRFFAAFAGSATVIGSTESGSNIALTVSKASLTVTPDNKSVTLGGTAPDYTFSVTGFVGNETALNAAGYIAPTCTSTYTTSMTADSSPVSITCSGGSATNYSFDTSRTASLTIDKIQLVVTPAAKSVTYGDTPPPYTFSITGFVGNDTEDSIQIPPTCTSTYAATTSAALTPSITCFGGMDETYSFDTTATAKVTIGKKELTVTPTAASVTYGSPVPTYSATFTGFVNSDDDTVLDTPPTCSSSYTPATGTSASPLTITCSGGSDDDYSFDTTATAQLTITAASVQIVPTIPASVPATQLVQSVSVDLGGAAAARVGIAAVPACAVGRSVTFTVSPAPVPAGPFTVTSDSSGVASTPAMQLAPSVTYSVGVSIAATGECAAQTTTSTMATGGTPGQQSTGNGSYSVTFGGASVTPKVSHSVTTAVASRNGDRITTWSGSLTWEVAKQWRLVGTVSSSRTVSKRTGVSGYASFVGYTCPASTPPPGTPVVAPTCGVIVGTAILQRWDATANKGRGAFVNTTYGTINFTATVNDGGTSRRCTGTTCTTVTNPDQYALRLFSPTVTLPSLPLPDVPVVLSGSLVNVI